MGNSVLQSGASIGAIITPLIILAMVMGDDSPGAWRMPFFTIGGVGVVWVILWFLLVTRGSIPVKRNQDGLSRSAATRQYFMTIAQLPFNRKFWAMAIMVVCINCTWQLIRAWLPKFLKEGRGYEESTALIFNSVYYIATDVGCILAGAVSMWLAARGMTVHASKLAVFGACALLSALTCVVAALPAGPALLGVLLLVAAGTLGLFPCYYSFSQKVDPTSVGRITGILSFIGWLLSSPIHSRFGAYIDKTGSYDLGFALVGLAPFIGLLAMFILWPKEADDPGQSHAK